MRAGRIFISEQIEIAVALLRRKRPARRVKQSDHAQGGGGGGYAAIVAPSFGLVFPGPPCRVGARAKRPTSVRADLFVTHGGFNGMQEALVAGVPLLVFPQMQEQAFNADRASELGVGVRLRRATPARIAAQANRILGEPRFRAAAARAGAELRRSVDLDGAVDAVLGGRRGPAASGLSYREVTDRAARAHFERGGWVLPARPLCPLWRCTA